jgi:glycosyltransferase involved in cell wall biosynthesis
MKIAFITTLELKSRASGVRRQAETWKSALEGAGCTVEYINPWHHYDWKSFDALHVFGGGAWMPLFVKGAVEQGLPVVHSPMIDSAKNKLLYRLVASVPHFGHRLYTIPAIHRFNNRLSTLCLARSRDEYDILVQGLGVPPERVRLVPICIDTSKIEEIPVELPFDIGQPFCFHASQFTQPRKNVVRLAVACGRLGLPLLVCGRPGSEKAATEIEKQVLAHTKAHFLRFVEKGQLHWLFRNSRLFALPSLYEGVGLAALEAGYYGAEAVVSMVGGARDYFGAYAHYANPLDISSIEGALRSALERPLQPALQEHVKANFTEAATCEMLLRTYQESARAAARS